MRGFIVVLACVAANAVLTPACFAAQAQTPPAATIASGETASCEHRYGSRRTLGFARCEQPAAVQANASACASHYAYRGHRRVDLPAQVCRPLFD